MPGCSMSRPYETYYQAKWWQLIKNEQSENRHRGRCDCGRCDDYHHGDMVYIPIPV